MDEAQRFDWLAAVDDGRILATGTPAELLERTGMATLEAAFIALLPEEKSAAMPPWRSRRCRPAMTISPSRRVISPCALATLWPWTM